MLIILVELARLILIDQHLVTNWQIAQVSLEWSWWSLLTNTCRLYMHIFVCSRLILANSCDSPKWLWSRHDITLALFASDFHYSYEYSFSLRPFLYKIKKRGPLGITLGFSFRVVYLKYHNNDLHVQNCHKAPFSPLKSIIASIM